MFLPKRKQLFITLVGFILTIGFGLAITQTALAQADAQPDTFGLQEVDSSIGLTNTDIRLTIARIIRTALGLLGVVTVGIILYGGFVYMTAGGSEEKVATARKIIINGVIGLAIVLSSFAITQFVLSRLSDATGSGNVPEFNQQNGGGGGGGAIEIKDLTCPDKEKFFAVESITPNQEKVEINNVVMRAVFTKSVTSPVDEIFEVRQDNNLKQKTELAVQAVPGTNNRVFEATFKNGACAGGGSGCVPEGKTYNVKINDNVTTTGGQKLQNNELNTSCPNKGYDTLASQGASFKVEKLANDVQAPISFIEIYDETGNKVVNSGQKQGKLLAGKSYTASFSTQDDTGVGYTSVIGLLDKATIIETLSGPSSESDKAFGQSFSFTVGKDIKAGTSVTFTITGYDVDHQQAISDLPLTVLGEGDGGQGSFCTVDNDCQAGMKCVQNSCAKHPYITNIDPPNGAPGNFVTIAGHHFGAKQGKVEYGVDVNKNGVIDAKEWKTLKIVSCENKPAWSDNYVIFEAPNEKAPSEVSIRLTDGGGKADMADDSFGPFAGGFSQKSGAGKFIVNTISRPGLCGVFEKATKATQAKPGALVQAVGKGFGSAQGQMSFGSLAAGATSWSNTAAEAVLPQNINPSTIGVRLQLPNNGEKSNGLPFTVLSSTSEETKPQIEAVSPKNPTPESYITVSGKGFGTATGVAYLTDKTGDDCSSGTCIEVNVPTACTGSWRDNEIVLELPGELTIPPGKQYYVVIKHNKSKQVGISKDPIVIATGLPAPSLCSVTPSIGPAPLPAGNVLTLKGDNLGPKDTKVYFYKKGADQKVITNWLFLGVDAQANSATQIQTALPLDKAGKSMSTGPIRVAVGSKLSNPVFYEVQDCRDGGAAPGKDWHCCTENEDAGLWKAPNQACAGEVRDAGYVWRFTTGIFPQAPFVIEDTQCTDKKVGASPSPWRKQPGGENECLNADLRVRFTTTMDDATINKNTVKLYKCAGIFNPDCEATREEIKIKKITLPGANELIAKVKDSLLEPKTWYRVELGSAIQSKTTQTVANVQETYREPLRATNPCGDGTAYCYTFRTGEAACAISSAGISPSEHTTNVLGTVQNPSYDIDENLENPAHPLPFVVWGKNDNSCAALPVEGFGWKWFPTEKKSSQAHAVKSAVDNRATVVAKEPTTNGVQISARIPADKKNNILKPIEAVSTLYIDILDPIVTFAEPNCLESCINPQIRAVFNRHMDPATYAKGFTMYKCKDATCAEKDRIKLKKKEAKVDKAQSTKLSLNVQLGSKGLEPNTYYVVSLSDKIRAYTGSKTGTLLGKPLTPFEWTFRTHADATACGVSYMTLNPATHVERKVGGHKVFKVTPYSQANKCSSQGQPLNRWDHEYLWTTTDAKVVSTTNFKFASVKDHNLSCGTNCLPLGSDVARDANIKAKGMCGNDQVDPGEDCDIALEPKTAGVSCTYECLRPGSTEASCGNGKIETEKGEECEPSGPNDPFCTSSCQNAGSGPFDGTPGKSVCGDGQVTAGEECDPGKDKDGIITNDPYCTPQCLNRGRPLAQRWCEVQGGAAPAACDGAQSVCGNLGFNLATGLAQLEGDEECEIQYLANEKKYALTVRNTIGNLQVLKANTEKELTPYCSNTCQLNSLCDLKTKVSGQVDTIGGFYCQAGTPGCTELCHIAGSSITYPSPSSCADGKVGTGEHPFCEVDKKVLSVNEGPVQIATAVGDKPTNNNTQIAKITATLASNKNISAQADYALQCGFNEFEKPAPKQAFNDCPNAGDGVSSHNSCCYPRSTRSEVFPADGAGILDAQTVCRNTALTATIDGEIKDASLSGNVVLLKGYADAKHKCEAKNGEKDATGTTKLLLSYEQEVEGGVFKKMWSKVKNLFASVTGNGLHATSAGSFLNKQVAVWCEQTQETNTDLTFTSNTEGKVVSSTIHLELKNVLDPAEIYGVLLKTGPEGVEDTRGVTITGPDQDVRDDFWVFKTQGKKGGTDGICKIEHVTMHPAEQLFNKPDQLREFEVKAFAAGGKPIVKTSAYDWEWDWQPRANPVFDIPIQTDDPTNNIVKISSRNVQGELTAGASARILKDITATGNQPIGKTFAATTLLTAQFCKRPWPAYDSNNTWKPFQDDKFNVSFKYCADKGQSGNAGDDLPFLKVVEPGGKRCAVDGKACSTSKDCALIPDFPSSYVYDGQAGEFVDAKGYGGVCFAVKKTSNISCKDSYDCSGNTPVCDPNSNLCVSVNYPAKALGYSPYAPGAKVNACGLGGNETYPRNRKQDNFYDQFRRQQGCVESLAFNQQQNLPNEEGLLKKLFFFNDQNEDAIGMRIFENPSRLSAAEWYKTRFPGTSTPKSVTIAGYDGVSDGRSVYVNAQNILADKSGSMTVYNNIYVFSINANAQPSTIEVFETVIGDIEFNINMDDHGYCVSNKIKAGEVDFFKEFTGDATYPLSSQSCTTDFDCLDPLGTPLEGTNGICSNARTKFKRDWVRLSDMKQAQGAFTAFVQKTKGTQAFPQLKAGSFVPGYALSRWSSWDTLATQLGGSLPKDPLNEWTQCIGANEQTCWDSTNTQLVCPTKMSVYEYLFSKTDAAGKEIPTGDYTLHVPFEFFKDKKMVEKNFGKEFSLDVNKLSFTPHCVDKKKISPLGGSCGDSIVQPGEQCDPQGSTALVDAKHCSGIKTGQSCIATCKNDCKWSYSASSAGTCGNGVVESGEKCDDGPLNGTYGHCAGSKSVTIPGCLKQTPQYFVSNAILSVPHFLSRIPSNIFNAKYGGGNTTEIEAGNYTTNEVVPSCFDDSSLSGHEYCESFGSTCSSVTYVKNLEGSEVNENVAGASSGCGANLISLAKQNKSGDGINSYIVWCKQKYNGKPGKSLNACQGPHEAYCGNGAVDSKNESCDPSAPGYQNYHGDKTKSCNNTCTGPGLYCGDDIVSNGEACDDGNNKSLDGCNATCSQKENVACLNEGPQFLNISKFGTDFSYIYMNRLTKDELEKQKGSFMSTDKQTGKVNWSYLATTSNQYFLENEPIDVCVNGGSTGHQVCAAAGQQCEEARFTSPAGETKKINCSQDLLPFAAGWPVGSNLRVQCKGHFTPIVKEGASITKPGCGNGHIDKDAPFNEVCDEGDKNGLACKPGYDQSCTYCAADCKKVLTVDPVAFCGNGTIEKDQGEKCDFTAKPGGGQSSVFALDKEGNSTGLLCEDMGSYECVSQCKTAINKCVTCGFHEEGADAHLYIINPLLAGSVSSPQQWPETTYTPYLLRPFKDNQFYSKPALGGIANSDLGIGRNNSPFKTPMDMSKGNTNKFVPGTQKTYGLQTNQLCQDGYRVLFNYQDLKDPVNLGTPSKFAEEWNDMKGAADLFEYQVNGEPTILEHEMILSPAVQSDEYRVVVKWSKDVYDSGIQLVGGWYSEGFTGAKHFTATQTKPDWCTGMKLGIGSDKGYWLPAKGKEADAPSCTKKEAIYTHPIVHAKDTHIQSFTVDAAGIQSGKGLGFFVQTTGGTSGPIKQYTNQDIEVLVYEYNEKQRPQYSVYKPKHVFKIKPADSTSSDPGAKYWYVFNIQKLTNNKTFVQPVQKIRTNINFLEKEYQNY